MGSEVMVRFDRIYGGQLALGYMGCCFDDQDSTGGNGSHHENSSVAAVDRLKYRRKPVRDGVAYASYLARRSVGWTSCYGRRVPLPTI